MYSKSQKLMAEILGTFVLVFFGCGTAMFTNANIVATSLAFGLSIVIAAYTVGKISGAHLNPAVSFAMAFDGRMSFGDAIAYSVAQIIGAFSASLCHLIIIVASDAKVKNVSFGANTYTGLNFFGAFLVEVILTVVFIVVVLSVTGSKDESTQKNAPLFIGLGLTFVHLMGINLTGTSVNPARSLAPAIFGIGGTDWASLKQLWIFLLAPMVGAFVAALIYSMVIKDKN